MRPLSLLAVVGGTLALIAASPSRHRANAPTREVIAVYLGTSGTDPAVADIFPTMRAALAKQARESGRRFIVRGVSLDPSIDAGMRQLARLGPFDEVSLGGNWTNSAVVRYLGGAIRPDRLTSIPQIVLLEREVQSDYSTIDVSPEREIGRFVGAEISDWVAKGAPIPR